MKFLAVGDFHGIFPKKLKELAKRKDIEFILCTGDLGGSDKLLKLIFSHLDKKEKWYNTVGIKKAIEYTMEDYNSGIKILEELNELNKKIYVIPGNWDFTSNRKKNRPINLKLETYQTIAKKMKNIEYINRKIKIINKINILFFGGTVVAHEYTKKGALPLGKRIKNIIHNIYQTLRILTFKKVDILFTHYTPYKFFDEVKSIKENPMNGKHVGFEGYTKYIIKNQPQLSISGHMHEYQGKKKLKKTTIIETGAAKEGKAVIINWNENKNKLKSIKFIK